MWESDGTDYYKLPGSKIAPEIEKYRARGVKFYDQVDTDLKHPHLLQVQREMFQAMQTSMAK